MHYTEVEICSIFRRQQNPYTAIKVLKELTLLNEVTIRNILESHGYKVLPQYEPKEHNDYAEDKFLELYKQGLNDEAISAILKIHKTTVKRWRIKNNLKPQRDNIKQKIDKQINIMLLKNKKAPEIAAKLGISESKVYKVIAELKKEKENGCNY